MLGQNQELLSEEGKEAEEGEESEDSLEEQKEEEKVEIVKKQKTLNHDKSGLSNLNYKKRLRVSNSMMDVGEIQASQEESK